MNLIFKKQLPRRTFLRGMGGVRGPADAGRDDARARAGRRLGVADAHGDPVFSERRPDGIVDDRDAKAISPRFRTRCRARSNASDGVPERHQRV